jgi:Protein of unknown function (DUF3800)
VEAESATNITCRMKIFIDDSGSFNWQSPGKSVFCGVTIADRDYPAVVGRFAHWRRSVIGKSKRELKGSELTEAQLSSFASKVLPWTDKSTCLTVVGVDTCRTRQHHIIQLRKQASTMFGRSSEIAGEHNNSRIKESYRQMSGWISSRSPENVAWIIGLEEAIIDSLQHTIIRFMDPEDDCEFEDLRIFIDQSFVQREQHVSFWREWLRAGLAKSSRTASVLPNTWRPRSHPFIKRYEIYPGLLDLNRLFVRNTGFFRSEKFEGLQIADICAHTFFRHHRGNGGGEAYSKLRPRIVGRDGAEINIIHVNESSLHTDDPRNRAGLFDIEEYKRRADELRPDHRPTNDTQLPE